MLAVFARLYELLKHSTYVSIGLSVVLETLLLSD